MTRLSYARILVEVDLLKELPQAINVRLLNGSSLAQQVIYETLSKFCKHCCVIGHLVASCSKAPKAGDVDQTANIDKEMPAVVNRNKKSKRGRSMAKEMSAAKTDARVDSAAPSFVLRPSRAKANGVCKAALDSFSSHPMFMEVASTTGD